MSYDRRELILSRIMTVLSGLTPEATDPSMPVVSAISFTFCSCPGLQRTLAWGQN
jgi:hypothetical protein